MIRMIDQFTATAETGETFTIQLWQEFITVDSLGGRETLPGLKSLRTDTGQNVNYIDENTFQIVQTDMIVRRG